MDEARPTDHRFTRRDFLKASGAGAAVAMLAGTGCSSVFSFGESSGGGSIDSPVVIGMSSATTGPYSEFGEGIRRGAQLAVDEWNADGGINGQDIEFRVLDDQLDADQAVTNVRQLLSEDVDAGFLPAGSGPTLAVLPLVLESGKPFINPIAQTVDIVYPEGVDNPPHQNIFSTAIQNDVEARVIGAFIESEGFESIGLIGESTPYGQTGLDIIEEQAERSGIEVVGREQYDQGDTSISAQLGNLRSGDPQAIVAIGLGADAATMAQDLDRLGMNDIPFIGTFGLFSTPFIELAGDLVVGKYGALLFTYAESDLKPEAEEFARKYLEEYGHDRWYTEAEIPPPFFQQNAGAYDGMNSLLRSIEAAGSVASEDVIEQLEQSSYDGAQLPTTAEYTPETHNVVLTEDMNMGRYIEENGEIEEEIIPVEV